MQYIYICIACFTLHACLEEGTQDWKTKKKKKGYFHKLN